MRLQSINLDYCRGDKRGATESPSAYEHLLLGGATRTFFARADEVEVAWEIVEPVIEKWGAEQSTDFPNYAAGSAGPAAADNCSPVTGGTGMTRPIKQVQNERQGRRLVSRERR